MSGASDLSGLWPYLTIVIAGFLPTEVWRWIAVIAVKDLREDSEVLHWVRLVATSLLIAVVAKLLLHPTGALAGVPVWGRLGAVVGGLCVLLLTRRSVLAAIIAGEAILIGSMLLKV